VGTHLDEFTTDLSIWDEPVSHANAIGHDKEGDFSRMRPRVTAFTRTSFARLLSLAGTSFAGTSFARLLSVPGTSFARLLSLAGTSFTGRTLFFGGGRTEGESDETGEAGNEDGIEPTFSLSGVCDHLNALLQGGMVADTRCHPCDGGCRKKGILHVEESAAVIESLGRLEPLQGVCIAAEFAIGLESGDRDPDERIEPMERVDEGRDPVEKKITVPDVLDLVHEDVTQHAGLEAGFPIARNDEIPGPESEDGRSGAGGSRQHAEIRLHPDLADHLPDEREKARIAAGHETRPPHKPVLPPDHRGEESHRPGKPDEEENLGDRKQGRSRGHHGRGGGFGDDFDGEGFHRHRHRCRLRLDHGGGGFGGAEPVPDSRREGEEGGHEELQADQHPEGHAPAGSEVPSKGPDQTQHGEDEDRTLHGGAEEPVVGDFDPRVHSGVWSDWRFSASSRRRRS
jgi:hypothetical protein